MSRLSILTLALLAACVVDPDAPDLPPSDDVNLDGACPLEDRYGAFFVEASETYTVLQGQVSQGVVPSSVLEETWSEGDCSLWRRNNPFCDPGCGPDEACDFDGSCVGFPVPQDLGTVTVDGLAEALALEPVMPGFNYFSTGLPHPAMTGGEAVRLRTGEGTWAPFELWGVGVEPLEVEADAVWTVDEGTAIPLAWAAPTEESRADVVFRLNIDQHGVSPLTVECTFDDAGSATVPAAAIDALLDAGVSGWPSASLARRTADSATVGDGCAELIVSSPRTGEVRLADFIPCDNSNPCPTPLECNDAVALCE